MISGVLYVLRAEDYPEDPQVAATDPVPCTLYPVPCRSHTREIARSKVFGETFPSSPANTISPTRFACGR